MTLYQTAFAAASIFCIMFAIDWNWAQYTRMVADGRPAWAGVYSVGIVLGGGAITLAFIYVGWWTIIPECLGAFCGTYVSVKGKKS